MTINQRNKGATYEREMVNLLKTNGFEAKRNLDQTRDGGGDILVPPYLFECKRYAKIAVYSWLEQAEEAAEKIDGDTIPIVFAKADRKPSIAILNMVDFMEILKDAELYRRFEREAQNVKKGND